MSKFLFGNVDKQGKLEENEISKNLTEEHLEYLTTALEVDFQIKNNVTSQSIKPNDDAADFQDEEEMVEDEEQEPLKSVDAYIPQAIQVSLPVSIDKPIVKLTGRLKFSNIFKSSVEKTKQQFRAKLLAHKKEETFPIQRSQAEEFLKVPYHYQKVRKPKLETKEKQKEIDKVVEDEIFTNSVLLDHWENKIIWDDEGIKRNALTKMFRNERLDDQRWTETIIWDDPENAKSFAFQLDDPTLVLLQSEVDEIQNFDPDKRRLPFFKKEDGKIIDYLNISEDYKYEEKKTKLGRVRQTHGPIKLQHSIPAAKLHPHCFKPLLHVKELRSFHRPALKFGNETITFAKVRTFKKKKYNVVDPAEMMRTPKDLTLKDTSKYVLVEYSEEYPLVLQNIGMASLIYNYYRKKDEKDNTVPKLPNGGPMILENVDVSPFFGFGDVSPGQTIQVLFNNLFRAPIFSQDPEFTDFLCIRHTYRGVTKYYLREIPNIYVAGQMSPMQEIPRPQARKITQALKMRLQVAAYRLMRNDPYRRLSYEKLRRIFPMFTDSQIRNKLKEFAQYLKKGENTGWWKLKSSLILPDEEGIRKLVTPESICLQESTLVASQRLKDTGYGADLGVPEDDENLDLEVQLAPWITTKNFLEAASEKGMLQLFGPGDPTGHGMGFSYMRASKKKMFFHHGTTEQDRIAFTANKSKQTLHKYSVEEQQEVYKAEIARIWGNQLRSLMEKRPTGPLDILADEKSRRESMLADQLVVSAPTSPEPQDDQAPDSEEESVTGKTKVLVINRLMKNGDNVEWKSEVVSDPRVINAYLKHRKMIEAPPKYIELIRIVEGIEPETDMPARIKRRTNAHVVRLQAKQGKRQPIPEDEEISESELPPENEKKPLSLTLKIAPLESDGKRKRTTSDPPFPTIKLVTRRRQSPECDLADIFSDVLQKLLVIPEAGSFIRSVSLTHAPGYLDVIKSPMCLEQMREKVKNFEYKTKADFLSDMELIVNNCGLYNGDLHSITMAAKILFGKCESYLEEVSGKIRIAEEDILKESRTVLGAVLEKDSALFADEPK